MTDGRAASKRRRKHLCPRCGGDSAEILYGMPTGEAMDAEARGELVCVGCMPLPGGPEHLCLCCGFDWGLDSSGVRTADNRFDAWLWVVSQLPRILWAAEHQAMPVTSEGAERLAGVQAGCRAVICLTPSAVGTLPTSLFHRGPRQMQLAGLAVVTGPLRKRKVEIGGEEFVGRIPVEFSMIMQAEADEGLEFAPLAGRLSFVKNAEHWHPSMRRTERALNTSDFRILERALLRAVRARRRRPSWADIPEDEAEGTVIRFNEDGTADVVRWISAAEQRREINYMKSIGWASLVGIEALNEFGRRKKRLPDQYVSRLFRGLGPNMLDSSGSNM